MSALLKVKSNMGAKLIIIIKESGNVWICLPLLIDC